jgi:DNA-binding Lrp family transcriptional regulator
MHEAAPSQPAWSRPADRRILEFLAESQPEYPTIVANRLGMHTPYVESRFEELADRGLVEAVTGEVVYRTTTAGERALEAGVLPE